MERRSSPPLSPDRSRSDRGAYGYNDRGHYGDHREYERGYSNNYEGSYKRDYEHYGRGYSPPAKRQRRDGGQWEDRRGYRGRGDRRDQDRRGSSSVPWKENAKLFEDSVSTFQFFSRQVGRTEENLSALYEEYKEEHAKRQNTAFFEVHKEQDWFQEKYKPDILVSRRNSRIPLSQAARALFFIQLNDLTLQWRLNGEIDDTKINSDQVLVVKNIPPTCTKAQIISNIKEEIENEELKNDISSKVGFTAIDKHQFTRDAVIALPQDTLKQLEEKLSKKQVDSYKFNVQLANASDIFVVKRAPAFASSTERLEADLKVIHELITLLDELAGFNASEILNRIALSSNVEEKVDLGVTYLRHVHFYCYYSGEECDNLVHLHTLCGSRYLRTAAAAAEPVTESVSVPSENATSTTTDSTEANVSNNSTDSTAHSLSDSQNTSTSTNATPTNEWATILDKKNQHNLQKEKNSTEVISAEDLQQQFYNINTLKEDESRFRCVLCSKLFRAPEFMVKHINFKHEEEITKWTDSQEEKRYFDNYVSDPEHLPEPQQYEPKSRRRGSYNNNNNNRSSNNVRTDLPPDPRAITPYTDFDAPVSGVQTDYRTQVVYDI